MMQIYVKSRATRRCPFSKKIIKPKTLLCVFNKHQYNNYVNYITEIFKHKLPIELIDKIIEMTNYKSKINRTGLQEYTDWINCKKRFNYLSSLLIENSDSSSSLSEDDSDDG